MFRHAVFGINRVIGGLFNDPLHFVLVDQDFMQFFARADADNLDGMAFVKLLYSSVLFSASACTVEAGDLRTNTSPPRAFVIACRTKSTD